MNTPATACRRGPAAAGGPSMYYTYILQSQKSNRYYIGSTNDVEKRIREHNSGKTTSTRKRGPFILVYLESYDSRQNAYRREMQIKKYKGGKAFKKLFQSI